MSAAACDKVPLLAPSQSTITLFASSTVVQANGTTDIIATVLEQPGTPVHNGTVVTFTTTLGSIEPREARTSNGQATVRFLAGNQSGEAEIRAVSGGAATKDPVKIKIGAAAASRIQLTASPSRLPAAGGASQIIAVVTDVNGNSLGGVAVSFSTDAGALSSSVATTSPSGEARTTLTTSRDATVSATAGAASTSTGGTTTSGVSGTVKVTVNTLAGLTLTPPTTTPVAGQPASFTVAVTSGTGTSGFQTVTIDFGDGSSQSLGALAGTTSVSHVYQSAGTYLVTVTGVDLLGDRTSVTGNITVGERPPLTMSISVDPGSTTAGTQVKFTVNVTAPTTGIVVRDVSIDFGDGVSGSLGPVTGTTTVFHTYCCAGTFNVTARATDSTGQKTSVNTQVLIFPRGPIVITISASPSSTTAGSPVTFTINVTAPTTPGVALRDVSVNFGDGSSLSLGPAAGTSSISHSYCCAGTFTASATATDSAGQQTSVNTQVMILARGPIAVTLEVSPATPTINSPATFTATVTVPTGTSVSRYDWDFGDGATASTTGNKTSHIYTVPGNKTVKVTVTTNDGNTGNAQIDIRVN